MNELRELLGKIKSLADTAEEFQKAGKTEEFNSTMEEIRKLQAEYNAKKEIEDTKKAIAAAEAEQGEVKTVEPEQKKAEPVSADKRFADAARAGFDKAMSEGSDPNGGYTVPEDIVTRAYKLRDAQANLRQYVRVENVKTESGKRTYKKRSSQTGFSTVAEHGKIGAKDTPQFDRISYTIQKYGGYYEMTNELLDDSDENIVNDVIEWIGNELRVTANKKILSVINTGWATKTNLTNLDGIKKALNVTLGQAFKPTSKIFTNDDGLQYLDTLKDNNGRYLLTPDPSDPAKLRLSAGSTTVPVVTIPNADMPTDAENRQIPFIIGDLKEAVEWFDRKGISLKQSDTAAIGNINAFEEDLTIIRAIVRFDCVVRDTAALVNGYISVGQ